MSKKLKLLKAHGRDGAGRTGGGRHGHGRRHGRGDEPCGHEHPAERHVRRARGRAAYRIQDGARAAVREVRLRDVAYGGLLGVRSQPRGLRRRDVDRRRGARRQGGAFRGDERFRRQARRHRGGTVRADGRLRLHGEPVGADESDARGEQLSDDDLHRQQAAHQPARPVPV